MQFNPNVVPPSEDMAPIPAGEYTAIIVDSQCRKTKNNDGHFLELTYQVIDGQYKNRKVWARFNFDNQNADAVRIGMEQLSAVCHACGNLSEFNPYNGAQHLHNIAHLIRVVFVPAKPPARPNDGNDVKGWKKLGGVATAASTGYAQAGNPQQANPAASNAAAPAGPPSWARPAA